MVRVIDSRDEPGDRTNTISRVQLLATDLKYPLVRVEEIIEVDPATQEESILSTRAMAASHIIVNLQPGIPEQKLVELNEKRGAHIQSKIDSTGTYLVAFGTPGMDTVPDAVAAYVAETDLFRYAEPDYVVWASQVVPNDPRFGELWGLHNVGQSGGTPDADIDAPEAWTIGVGNNVLVAVIDTGVDYTHADLAANIWTNPGEVPGNGIDDEGNGYIDDVHGIDAYNADADPFDDHGHGTHVSGTIAGVGNNGIGVVGVCWQARVMGVKFLSASGSGFTSDAITGINYAAMMKARVMNNSWGGDGYSVSLYDAIENANRSNALFCAAAGNSSADNDVFPNYPSSFTNANVLAVAASTRLEALSGFSSYGATSVDLAAPGSAILSTLPGNNYASWNGTSMATPHVAGAAALLFSQNPYLSAGEVRRALMESTDPSPSFAGKMVSGGRLNVARALSLVSGICFDRAEYFSDIWATITLTDTNFVGDASQVVTLSSSHGDAETLTLYAQEPGADVFTNRVFIAYGTAVPGNNSLEGLHGTEVYASYVTPVTGNSVTGSATVFLVLDIAILTPPTAVPFSVTNFSVTGINNGNVLVSMVVSNEATGEQIVFAATNAWTAPAVALSDTHGRNVIHVSGTNTYGLGDHDSVEITRYSPSAATNYVSQGGSHVWPYVSWATAATNISSAIAAAANTNVVLVTNGVYGTETVVVDRPMTLRSVNGPAVTIVDGMNVRPCIAITADALVDGFTLTHGLSQNGGGAYLSDGEIRNSLITSNTGSWYGGGLYLDTAGLANQCVISSNNAFDGGGIEFNGGGVASNCQLIGNSAMDSGGGADCWGGGTLIGCLVSGNYAAWYGGGVECWGGGTIHSSTIVGNRADYDGGGVESFNWGSGGSINNSLIASNTAGRYGGGSDAWGGGDYVNCTIINNSASEGGGLYCYYAEGQIVNSVIYYNSAAVGDNIRDLGSTGQVVESSCIFPLIAGSGNITNNPQIAGLEDPHLMPGSPCIDSGDNAAAAGNDIDGDARIANGQVDIGCDEYVPGGETGLLSVAIQAESAVVAPGYAADFKGMITGRSSHFVWDFGGVLISNAAIASHSWPLPGWYPVILTAYNTDYPSGVAATVTVEVSSSIHYVSTTGAHVSPFDSWANAATNIQSAIDACQHGGAVWVASGTYNAGGLVRDGMTIRAGLSKPVLVSSVNGPEQTAIVGRGPMGASAVKCAYIASGAVLSGFTLTNGHTTLSGSTPQELYGGGAYIEAGGIISNCIVVGNQAGDRGGGLYFQGGGAAVNVLIASNYSAYYGGGVFFEGGGSIVNGTISSNRAEFYGGGIYCFVGGDVRNSIVYFNVAPNYPNVRNNGTESQFEYLCTTPTNGLPLGNGCIASNPLFLNAAAGNYRLQSGSPCIDSATNVAAITMDLDGLPRPLDGDTNGTATADMGAYEFLPVNLDTDGDGMLDVWEMANGLNRLVNDAAADPDGDGLTNLQEYQNSTDPFDADTDGDGYSDFVETQAGSNPLSAASTPAMTLVITAPSAAATFSTTNGTVDLAGTLTAPAAVTNITVSNNRHISLNTCPVAGNWSFVGMPVYSGQNVITITAYDVLGNPHSDTLTVTRTGDARYNDLLFSGALVQEIVFPDNLVPGASVAVQWKALSYVPLRARLGTGSKTQGWFLYKNADYMGMQASPWNISGRNASVYSYQCTFVVPTNTGDFSIWFNHGQMDGNMYMSAVVPDGVDPRPDLVQSKLITRTIVAGGTNVNPQSDVSIVDSQNPFESTQQALMRSGGTITAIDIATNGWSVSNSVVCQWTVLSYTPVQSRLLLLNLVQQQVWAQAVGSLIGSSLSSWHIGATYATEYTFRTQITVPDQVGTQQIYFVNMQQGLAGASWMAGNIPAGVDPAPVLFNGMYGRFIERTIEP